jgi:hypothetical protein
VKHNKHNTFKREGVTWRPRPELTATSFSSFLSSKIIIHQSWIHDTHPLRAWKTSAAGPRPFPVALCPTPQLQLHFMDPLALQLTPKAHLIRNSIKHLNRFTRPLMFKTSNISGLPDSPKHSATPTVFFFFISSDPKPFG